MIIGIKSNFGWDSTGNHIGMWQHLVRQGRRGVRLVALKPLFDGMAVIRVAIGTDHRVAHHILRDGAAQRPVEGLLVFAASIWQRPFSCGASQGKGHTGKVAAAGLGRLGV